MSETYTPVQLLAGGFPLVSDDVTILANEGALSKGAVLGKISKGSIAIAAGTNTGDGEAGAITAKAKAKVGVYTLRCITAASNAGVFAVFDPDGYRLDDLTVAVAYDNGHFGVTIGDGDADFIVGDSFTVTVAGGANGGKYKLVDSTAVDGSQDPVCVLAEDTTVGVADVAQAPVYCTGEFNEDALTFGGTDTKATHRDALEARNIFLRSVNSL